MELSDKLREFVAQRVQAFGLGIDAVTMTISLPEEIQQAMTRGVARGLEESGFLNNVGDLNRYEQARRADAMLAAAQNEGGGAAGSAIQAGLGVALGAQMANAVQPQAQPQQFAATQQPMQGAPPPLPTQQLFHFDQGGQPAGPYPVSALRPFVSSGQLTRDTVVWTEGMANWAPASSVPALQSLFSTPPPLPGTPPPLPQQ